VSEIRLGLQKPKAAEALSISVDPFERYVQDEVRVIRRGRLRLYPVAELERWVEANADRVLEQDQS
jgi:hypothetical protein